jgi:ribonuclease HI
MPKSLPHSLTVYVDGSSRGNPGPSGIGIAAFASADKENPVHEISKYIGITTNNVAEYEAAIHALKWLIDSEIKKAVIKLDSELVYKQITGTYKVRVLRTKVQLKRINMLKPKIKQLSFQLIPREENKVANRLAQRASKKVKLKKKKFEQNQLLE